MIPLAEWVLFDAANRSLYCTRCEKRLQVPLPIRALALVAIMDAFVELHAGCVELTTKEELV